MLTCQITIPEAASVVELADLTPEPKCLMGLALKVVGTLLREPFSYIGSFWRGSLPETVK